MNNKKKILFFVATLQSGGGERVLTDLVNYFSNTDKEVFLVMMEQKGVHLKEVNSNVKIINLNTTKITRAFFKLITVLKEIKPDVCMSSYVHLNPLLVFANILAKTKSRIVLRIGIPLSLIFKKFTGIKDGFFLPLISRIFYKKADLVVCVSGHIKKDMEKNFSVKPDRAKVIYSPKDIESILAKGKEFVPKVFNGDTKKILFVGRLVRQKNVETLIRSLDIVLKRFPNTELILVGGGTEKGKLKKLSDDLSISDKIHFEDTKDNPYVYMENSDIFVLPSRWEGLPNVLIEAMIFGLPIVSTDCISGPREILIKEEKEIGKLVPVFDYKKMAEEISEIIGNVNLQKELSEKSKERSKDFSKDVIFPIYEKALFPER